MGLEEKARAFAEEKHKGQFRKDGITPYFTHPACVVNILRDAGITDETTLATGWLHDVVEDCSVGFDEIKQLFGEVVLKYVTYLTKGKQESREMYMMNIANFAPMNAKLVKIADVIHNVMTSGNVKDPADRKEMIAKKLKQCERYYLKLAKEINENLYQRLNKEYRNLLMQ